MRDSRDRVVARMALRFSFLLLLLELKSPIKVSGFYSIMSMYYNMCVVRVGQVLPSSPYWAAAFILAHHMHTTESESQVTSEVVDACTWASL